MSETDSSCILCGSISNSLYVSFNKLTYVKCDKCGLIFQYPRVPDVISENIRGIEISGEHFIRKEMKSNRTAYYTKYLRMIEKYLHSSSGGRRMLELGCGAGGFLRTAKDRGWQVTGVEISETLSKFARDRFGLNVLLGDFKSLNLPKESFDAAVLNMVIEHLENPLSTLQEIYKLLRCGGVLLVHTPNYSGKMINSSKDEKYFPAAHIYLFTPSTLQSLIGKAGFSVRHTTTTGFRFRRRSCLLVPIERMLSIYYSSKLLGHRLRVIAQK